MAKENVMQCTCVHIHTLSGMLLSHKKGNLPFATTWIDLDGVILSEVSQTEVRYHTISLTYGI